MSPSDITFILLAAGHSSRMERPKALLPFGNSTVIGVMTKAIRAAHIQDVRAVVAANDWQLREHCETIGLPCIENHDTATGMSGSVVLALKACGSEWLGLCPCDLPNLGSAAISACLAALTPPIVQPTCDGPRHPVFIHESTRPTLMRWLEEGGILRDFLREQNRHFVECWPCSQFNDMDTPDDYRARLQESPGTISDRKAE